MAKLVVAKESRTLSAAAVLPGIETKPSAKIKIVAKTNFLFMLLFMLPLLLSWAIPHLGDTPLASRLIVMAIHVADV
jgi:hypothetical protein